MPCLVIQSCQTLQGLQPARLLCPWNSPGKNTRVGCHALLQGIFPNQGSNPGLLYCLSHQGNPRILEWVAIPSSRGFPIPGIKPRSPTIQADSLPSEPLEKPWNSHLIFYRLIWSFTPKIMSLVVLTKIRWIAKTLNPFLLCFLSYGLATIITAIYTNVSCL